VRAPCPSSCASGKIGTVHRAVRRRTAAGACPYGIVCLLTIVGLGGCGAPTATTCGIGGVSPQPNIGGEVVYTCALSPAIAGALFLLDLSTGRVRQLTNDRSFNGDPAWSPDGRHIAFQSTRGGRSELYVMDLASGQVRWLTGGLGFNELPRWSPDGSWISFNSSRDGISAPVGTAGFHRNIYLIRPDGSNLHRLTNGRGFNGDAVWSPDGAHLAFTSDRAGTFDLYTMNPDGTDQRQETHHESGGGFASYASWSPDSAEVVFDATNGTGDAARASIYRQRIGNGQTRRLTRGYDFRPDWSSDGAWIVFVGKRQEHTQLFVVRSDGSDLIELTGDTGDKDLPRWRPF
jgi:Tol biopolymer transport system component